MRLHCNIQTLQPTHTRWFALDPTFLQSNTATRCNTLQHAATRCNTLQHTASHRITLHHTASYCNILQHTATHCNTLQRTSLKRDLPALQSHCITLHHTTSYCNTLQHTACTSITLHHPTSHYIILQHTATHCNTLQHTATHCNTLAFNATYLHFNYQTTQSTSNSVFSSHLRVCTFIMNEHVCTNAHTHIHTHTHTQTHTRTQHALKDHCTSLQRSNTLQLVATLYNTRRMAQGAWSARRDSRISVLQCVAVCCSVLQYDAV